MFHLVYWSVRVYIEAWDQDMATLYVINYMITCLAVPYVIRIFYIKGVPTLVGEHLKRVRTEFRSSHCSDIYMLRGISNFHLFSNITVRYIRVKIITLDHGKNVSQIWLEANSLIFISKCSNLQGIYFYEGGRLKNRPTRANLLLMVCTISEAPTRE